MKKPDLTIGKPDLEETTDSVVVEYSDTDILTQKEDSKKLPLKSEGSVFEIIIILNDITEEEEIHRINERVSSLKEVMNIVSSLKDSVIKASFGYKHVINLSEHTEYYKKIKKVE